MGESLTCRQLIDFLDDYTEGSLPPARREAFEGHLRICPHCRDYLADYRASIELARSLGEAGDAAARDAGVPAELVHAIRRALRGPGGADPAPRA